MQIEETIEKIKRNGPDRVLVDEDGETVTPLTASIHYPDVKIEVIFIRKDGWSLGAHSDLIGQAYDLWADHWAFIWMLESNSVTTIEVFLEASEFLKQRH